MKLLVVSDVHGDLDALERAVDAEADADAVIFWETVCGSGGPAGYAPGAEDLQRAGQPAIMPPLPRRTGWPLSAVCYFIIHMVIYIM